MKINGIETNAKSFAYDGCHKIYLIESEQDEKDALALNAGYEILPIDKLKTTYAKSCGLKFINNWSLTTQFVGQGEKAKFN